MQPNDTRACARCGTIKAPDQFGKPEPSGKRQSRCRACKSAEARLRRAQHPDLTRAAVRKYAAANLSAVREAQRRYRAMHPDRVAESGRRYVLANPDRVAARHKRYRATRIDHYREYGRQYSQTERGRLIKLAIGHRWRARQQGAPGFASATQIAARVAYYGGLCWMCGVPAATIDHVIPLSRGGTNWPANLRPACALCNSRKKDRSYKLFL